MILTIPETPTIYSMLSLDVFGDAFESGIPSQTPGTYALILDGMAGNASGRRHQGRAPLPGHDLDLPGRQVLPHRPGHDRGGERVPLSLRLATLADYPADPNSGAAIVLPSVPVLRLQLQGGRGHRRAYTPKLFLRTMQRAVHDPGTQPMYPSDLRLSRQFDQVFAAAQGNPVQMRRIERAVGDAYRAIVARWMTHVGATNWIHFDNIAAWGTAYLDRAAGTEYIQFGNNRAAASYWTAFVTGPAGS